MFYLVTGGVGTGKTLFTLKWVRELQQETGRPVCFCLDGRGETVLRLKGDALEFGWREIDFVTWENQEDGTIFILDECHELLPVRPLSKGGSPPDHIQALARHRHRGFDFFLITQHPKNLDSFVRRLIADPGWHRHLKRRNGGKTVACLQWPNVFERCESNTAGKTATVTDMRYPVEVFDWYDSASIHTAKFRIPKQMYIIAAAFLLVPLIIWYAVQFFKDGSGAKIADQAQTALPAASAVLPEMPVPGPAVEQAQTRAQYLESLQPRLSTLLWTAPRYDALTEPKRVPYPAACLLQHENQRKCKCWTQDATPLNVPFDVCRDIAQGGIFIDWHDQGGFSGGQPPAPAAAMLAGAPASAPVPSGNDF